ncbi:Ubiquitin [Gracilaria domingensis]|nr:Ubiquitin [Gracilaria domingensis]
MFKRTAAEVDELEAAHTALSASTQPIQNRKDELTSIQTKLAAMQPAVQKFVVKADQGEKDPNKRVYGPSMVVKIRELSSKLTSLSESIDATAASIDVQFAEYEKELEIKREKQRAEEDRLHQEEQERLQQQRIEEERQAKLLEEQRKKEEQLRLEKEKAEKEAALKRAQEEAQLKEQQRIAKEKADAEQKEREQQQLREQQVAEEAKRKEEQQRQAEEASKGITLTIKTTRGKSLPLRSVPPSCPVHELKALIEKEHGIPKIAQRLIFQGRLLSDAKTIDSFNVKDGCAVHLVENTRATTSTSPAAAPAAPKPLVPPGTVCHLANGRQQFDSILQNCASRRLVVVDWSAPWCGPCRMINPVFERLANRFSDVTFIKVDTEATAANAELASQSGISAYPTFHYYINSRCVHSFSGANATNIESGIRTYRTQVSPSATTSLSSGSRSTAGPSPAGQLTRSVLRALTTLKQNCSQQDFIVAVRTLLTFVRNVVNNPGQGKYRKVRTANSTFQTRLASKPGGTDAMLAFGFERVQENGESFLVLSEQAAANSELSTINTQLEQALAAAGGATAPQSSQPRAAPTPSPAAGATNNMGVNPLAGMMGGGVPPGLANMMGDESMQSLVTQMLADPNFMQIAQEITADPSAMQRLAEAHRAMTSGDVAAMQRLQNDPALMRLQAAMASNPTVMNEAMRQLATGMGNAFPGGPMPSMPGAGTPAFNAATQATQATQTQTPSNPAPAAYPGAPTTAEEEERLLQEAIRLSMQDAGTDSNQKPEDKNGEQDPSKQN